MNYSDAALANKTKNEEEETLDTRQTLMAALVLTGGLSGAAQAALHDRGGGFIYDDVLDVTWLQDANYAKTSGYDADGVMKWSDAKTWAAGLSFSDGIHTYDNWRLPSVNPVNSVSINYSYAADGSTDFGFNITSQNSEMAYMYYANLSNPGGNTPTGAVSGCYVQNSSDCLDNFGPFSNLQAFTYWSGSELDTTYAFTFVMANGYQLAYNKTVNRYAWAVRDGDVAAVPEPETYAMMLAGLGLVGFMASRHNYRKARLNPVS